LGEPAIRERGKSNNGIRTESTKAGPGDALAHIARARREFVRALDDLRTLSPFGRIARLLPPARAQVRPRRSISVAVVVFVVFSSRIG
jgi:hypothetical protein